jgi:hypothetical protein
MPAALQVINAFKQNLTGGAFEALAPGTGDSFTFQNVPQDAPAYATQVWGVDDASPAELSLFASRWHDQQFGVRGEIPDGSTLAPANRSTLITAEGLDQRIFPSDVLNVNVFGTAADNVNASIIIYYSDLPGIAARLATYEYVRANNKNLVGIHVSLTSGSGDYGASAALNSADNRLHANTDYAVLGFTSPEAAALVTLSGVDTGNQRVGGPVLGDGDKDAQLFVNLARYWGAALIPIINSNNAGAINLQAAQTTGGSLEIDVMLQELPQPFNG